MTQSPNSLPDGAVTVLLTRPAEASERTARSVLDAARHETVEVRIVISPVLEIVTTALSTSLDSAVSVILTSAHATEALSSSRVTPGQRAYCVGQATARAAQALGFETLSADGDAAALVRLIEAHHKAGPLLWLRGAHRREDLGSSLRDAGYDISEIVVYDQEQRPLTQDALDLLAGSGPVVLPLYSPRSARLLGEACASAQAPLHVVAISDAARQGWCGPTPATVRVADHPDGPSMVAALLHTIGALRSG